VPSRLSAIDIARLRQSGASPAGPPPAGPAPGALAATSCVEVQRLVSSSGIITLANQVISVGSPLAGRIVTIEPGDTTLRVIDSNGELLTIVPRNSPGEITRFKAHGSKHSH